MRAQHHVEQMWVEAPFAKIMRRAEEQIGHECIHSDLVDKERFRYSPENNPFASLGIQLPLRLGSRLREVGGTLAQPETLRNRETVVSYCGNLLMNRYLKEQKIQESGFFVLFAGHIDNTVSLSYGDIDAAEWETEELKLEFERTIVSGDVSQEDLESRLMLLEELDINQPGTHHWFDSLYTEELSPRLFRNKIKQGVLRQHKTAYIDAGQSVYIEDINEQLLDFILVSKARNESTKPEDKTTAEDDKLLNQVDHTPIKVNEHIINKYEKKLQKTKHNYLAVRNYTFPYRGKFSPNGRSPYPYPQYSDYHEYEEIYEEIYNRLQQEPHENTHEQHIPLELQDIEDNAHIEAYKTFVEKYRSNNIKIKPSKKAFPFD